MANHSPQRARRSQPHPLNQGSLHNMPPRETSRSPPLHERPRALKAQSMPLVPSVNQIYAANGAAPPGMQAQQQPSPTVSTGPRRSSPPAGQISRLLPTPPHPNPPNILDSTPERRITPPPPPQHSHSQPILNTHYPRPMPRTAPPQFLTKFEMTDELLAEIERADQQQSQNQIAPPAPHPYTSGYPSRSESPSPPKDPHVERIRAMERASPNGPDNGQQRRTREPQATRESPKARDRQPTSPIVASFAAQVQAHTPERRGSPLVPGPGESPAGYTAQYSRDSPPVLRRQSNAVNPEPRSILSLASQTPPLQAIARTPDRSLPVQEEAEDEFRIPSKNGPGAHESWKNNEQGVTEHNSRRPPPSPAPSSDLHPEGNLQRYDMNLTHGGRESRTGYRGEDGKPLLEQPQTARYVGRDSGEEEGGYTPRSPTAGLPDTPHDTFYHQQNMAPRQPVRVKTRNGSTDGLGMRSLDPSAFEQTPSSTALPTPLSDRPSQFVESRRSVQDLQHQYHPQPQPVQQHQVQQYQQHQIQQHHQQHQHNQQRYSHDPRTNQNGRYAQPLQPQVYPDDFPSYGEDYIQSYLQSPRPEAPIPPTPHSQSAAPSPSPLISEGYNTGGKNLPPFSPVAPVGSPYPYPFSHVRRNQPVNGPNRPHYDPNHPSVIQEQLAKQWQIYAQNNHGNVTDSTLSPSSTPFPAAAYNPWALWHTNRMGRVHDTTSLQSSPSHEPIPLPPPPRKKDRLVRRQASSRKPPPRVDSTQPRETSPEPSSSGEETAGEERFSVPPPEVINNGHGNHNWPTNGTVPIVPTADDDPDWIDEQEECDDDDLLELEYHPNYISNVEKRRRKWEMGWEALVQAFQNLDRQTDATMVLLAAPSHSTKLHSVRSRSVRRQPALANSSSMTDLRTGFKRIAAQRRSTRSMKSSLVDRLINCATTSGDGSDGSSESREEDLRHLLETALGSLGVLGGIFEQRETRWVEEMQRINEDRERVELLLAQVLGENQSTLRSPRVLNVQGP